jgi:acyl carrier protein
VKGHGARISGVFKTLYAAVPISGSLKLAPLECPVFRGFVAMDMQAKIFEQFEQVARDQDKNLAPLATDTVLLESGLDSLCFAIIVAKLEDELGVDPFTAAEDVFFPVTVGEFVKFYEDAAAA